MRLQDFSALPANEQTRLLYKAGTYIGKRKLAATTIVLYQLEGFYAEIFVLEYRRVIGIISSFVGTERIEPYLLQIDVEHLVSMH